MGLNEKTTQNLKPTQRLFEAIERELTAKQDKIQELELEQDEKNEEFKLIANEITRLREEAVTIKRLNQRLSNRLQQIMKNDVVNFKNIDNLSKEQCKALLIKYANGHKKEKDRRRHLEQAMVKLLAKLKASKKIYHKLIKIQSAAQEQAEFIRTLQGRQNEIGQYRDTIISQEE